MRPWRIIPLRVRRSLYWIVFYRGHRIARSTDLPRLLSHIAAAERSNDNVYRAFVGEQW